MLDSGIQGPVLFLPLTSHEPIHMRGSATTVATAYVKYHSSGPRLQHHIILIHLCYAFPVCSESPHGNVVAVNSQCIDLCYESRLSNGDRRDCPVFGVAFGGKCVSGDRAKKGDCNDRCGILKRTKHVRRLSVRRKHRE
jgi:hypothetical protein